MSVSMPRELPRFFPTKHFVGKLANGMFDLAVIAKLTDEVRQNPNQLRYEVTTGNATVVAERIKNKNTLKLVTGWIGNRKKETMEVR